MKWMSERKAEMPFILVLHCPRSRGSLSGNNNFLRSSFQVQNIPINDMGLCFVFLYGHIFIAFFGHTCFTLKAPF